VRLLDAAGLEPYRVLELVPGLEWWAYDRVDPILGSPLVMLELTSALTLSPTVNELWVQHESQPAAFTSDTSTLNAGIEQDWLAWEGVYELARRKLAVGTNDKSRWQGLRDRATQELAELRAFWRPREAVRIATFP
jgi:hypothetical protein